MKTILVVYTASKLNKKESQTLKRYCFNTNQSVKVGDLLNIERYDPNIQVVEVLKTYYKYVSLKTGKLSNRREADVSQVEIRQLVIRDEQDSNSIEATRL